MESEKLGGGRERDSWGARVTEREEGVGETYTQAYRRTKEKKKASGEGGGCQTVTSQTDSLLYFLGVFTVFACLLVFFCFRLWVWFLFTFLFCF